MDKFFNCWSRKNLTTTIIINLNIIIILLLNIFIRPIDANSDAKRLYDDLLSSYNRLVRPVSNNSQSLKVKLGLKLTQLIDVNLKNQMMTTNVWVTQEWYDHKLKWDPEEYGGVRQLYVPSEQLWLPDIVLYNNGDGNYEITIMTKAILHYDGLVTWNPPAIYKSSCNIDINYFPFDYQECTMKFGSWTYSGNEVDLIHLNEGNGTDLLEYGIDLSEFYLNVEWDIMHVPALRKVIKYSCCPQFYPDITFNITLRRKTLFYTINLIIPCVSISCLSILVFYMPSDSGEKVTLSVSILLSLSFFLLVLIEIIPSTSLVIPLIGKYLIFTMVLVTLSVIVTILVMNIHFRSPSTHRMSPWIRKTFMHSLPRWLLMKSPQFKLELPDTEKKNAQQQLQLNLEQQNKKNMTLQSPTPPPIDWNQSIDSTFDNLMVTNHPASSMMMMMKQREPHYCYPRKIDQIILNAIFIAHHIDNADEYKSNQEDWKYVSMVLDRLFLWIFTLACIVGTGGIFMVAPSIYDLDVPLDIQMSTIVKSQF
ncbi:Neurotransmitter-gated ion-channel transmembrane region [Dermatophagoides pteronyssinus]|uniref:Neurotransmitter-gated ion-channel transmembrane region n=2 Tax=Dermatophagoides pteronyssinus TaxID=6956 RepID=A0ABQ8ITK0_DERPT|nr:acetylcholine receptor subunit alpha-like 1 [Dermatophagoides pteronyssinus]KAH9413635.1 Neurotransmitter-gated ion-channel transmembrane region [Dermatophagoides pteronyssinus]